MVVHKLTLVPKLIPLSLSGWYYWGMTRETVPGRLILAGLAGGLWPWFCPACLQRTFAFMQIHAKLRTPKVSIIGGRMWRFKAPFLANYIFCPHAPAFALMKLCKLRNFKILQLCVFLWWYIFVQRVEKAESLPFFISLWRILSASILWAFSHVRGNSHSVLCTFFSLTLYFLSGACSVYSRLAIYFSFGSPRMASFTTLYIFILLVAQNFNI